MNAYASSGARALAHFGRSGYEQRVEAKASSRVRWNENEPADPRARARSAANEVTLAEASDEELAVALGRGDPKASRTVWIRYSPLVRGILRRSLGPEHEVEDIVQDVFLRIFDKIRSLRNPAALKAFIISVTVLSTRYEIRRLRVRRWVRLASTPEEMEVKVSHADVESRQVLVQFYRVLDRINTRDRTAFVLRFIEGMNLAEVSTALGVSTATARRCLGRARQRVALLSRRDPVLAEYIARLEIEGES